MNVSILEHVLEGSSYYSFFLIRFRFPQSESLSQIIISRYGDTVIKRLRKYEKADYGLRNLNLIWNFLLVVEKIT